METGNINIYGKLVAQTGEGKVADTDQIFDKTLGKFQSEINGERENYYTKDEIDSMVEAIKQFNIQIANTLPEASESTMFTIYLIPSSNPKTTNSKDEYITVKSGNAYSWEQVGSTEIDLSGYSTTEQMNAAILSGLNNLSFSTGEKVANLGIDEEPTAGSGNLVKSGGVFAKFNDEEELIGLKYEAIQGYFYNVGSTGIGGQVSEPTASNSYHCVSIRCSQGDKFKVSTKGATNARAYAFTNANMKLAEKADENAVLSEDLLTAPCDGYLLINCMHNYYSNFKAIPVLDGSVLEEIAKKDTVANQKITEEQTRAQLAENAIQQTLEELEPLTDKYQDVAGTFVENALIDVAGNFVSNSSYKIFRYSVSKGQVLHIKTQKQDESAGSRSFVYAYNGEEKVERVAPATQKYLDMFYTVPFGVDNICVSCYWRELPEPYVGLLVENGIEKRVSKIEREFNIPKISNPPLDIRQSALSQLRVLNIGNSFTNDAATPSPAMLNGFVQAAGLSVSDLCVYSCVRSAGSFKTFYDSWHGQDTYDYGIVRRIGSITQPITGDTPVDKLHSCIIDAKWDLIIIQQVSTYSDDYDLWEGDTDGGYLTEMLRIIRFYQPQATIGYLMPHASFQRSAGGDTALMHSKIAESTRLLSTNYGIDFIIPVSTAIENLRSSDEFKQLYPNVTKGYSRDAHHLGLGLAQYVANASYFQCILGKRYGATVYGNSFRYTVENAQEQTFPDENISVTDDNALKAQMCALLACNDMYTITNPDGIQL